MALFARDLNGPGNSTIGSAGFIYGGGGSGGKANSSTDRAGGAGAAGYVRITFPVVPIAPTNLVLVVASPTQINLSWTDNSSNETGFEIQRATSLAGPFITDRNVNANTSTANSINLNSNTTYYYRVRALNGTSQSTFTTVINATTLPPPPAAPSGLIATTVSATAVNLTWTDNSTNETGFQIERSTTSGSGFVLVTTTAAGVISYSDTGLTANTTYHYRIRAINTGGNSAYTTEANSTTLPLPPAAPSGLIATTVSATAVNLTWTDNSNSETGFQIERSTTSGSGFVLVTTTAAGIISYSDSGLTANTTYYYRIRAINTGGNSAYTTEANATTLPLPPAVPSGLTATTVSATAINLTWADNSTNETGFQIERSTTSGSGFVLVATTAAGIISYSDSGLTANTTYYYRIRAINAGGNSAYTTEANATTLPLPPTAPSGLTATTASSTTINLAWTDNSTNETGFQIERSTTSGSGFVLVTTTVAGATSYSDSGLTANTTFYYIIRAINIGGNSAYTTEANSTTLPLPPTAPSGLTATTVSATAINLTWTDNSTNETGFQIERSTTSGSGFTLIATTTVNVTSYSSTGLTANTTYYYRIRAINTGGNSAYNTEANATTLPLPPAAPSGLIATTTSSTSINLTWTDNSSNETGFEIQHSTHSVLGFTLIATASVNATSYSSTGLTANTTYYYKIRAINTGGNSANTAAANATTSPLPPTAASGLTATTASSTGINLTWTDNSTNETGFQIERSTTSGSGFTLIATTAVNTTSYSSTGLAANTTYYYRIRAINTGGNSAYTTESSNTTLPLPPIAPSGLTATAASSTSINLAWVDNSNNELGFQIERSTMSGTGFTVVGLTGVNVTSFLNSGLSPSTTYYFRVRAVNAGGASVYSNETAISTFPPAPVPPSSLIVGSVGASGLQISWTDNSNNETGFNIERSTSSGTGFSLLSTTASNTTLFEDTNLSPTTTYYYRVNAVNAGGASTFTNEVSAITITQQQQILNELAFQYRYDGRRRMIMKKVPGADVVYMVYDSRDRLVLTQDGEQRKTNKWMFTKYDALNRPVLTGLYAHNVPLDQSAMQAIVDAYYANPTLKPAGDWFETYSTSARNIHLYDNKSFPQITDPTTCLTITYYDNYDFRSNWGAVFNYLDDNLSAIVINGTYNQQDSETLNVIGQLTGTKTRILDGGNNYLKTVTYYDDKSRIIQMITDTYLNGTIAGSDRVSTLFDFPGKVLKTRLNHNIVSGTPSKTITRRMEYDHAGRLLKTFHQVDNNPEVLLSANVYNEIGQLVDKKLYSVDNGSSFRQSVDYRYNIRGWLTSINNASLSNDGITNDDGTDLFGMNLLYNLQDAGLDNTSQFNGNISAIKWSSNLGLANEKERGYSFLYDPMNRLLSASHKTRSVTWTPSSSYHEDGLLYDLNGNIKSLNRKGANASSMDALTFSYSGNKLLSVADVGDKASGFTEPTSTSGNDYIYDTNGNMVVDKNKSISTITYNHLNLPAQVTKNTGEFIKYIYDATGKKLRQEVYNASNILQKSTDYAGEFVYEGTTGSTALQFVNTEEGRIIPAGNEYQYHLKDHLGNVRVTFTSKDEVEAATATLETVNMNAEQSKFLRYEYAKRIQTILFDHTNDEVSSTIPGYSVRLNGGENEVYGLARSLSVMPGDVISTEVYYKYIDPTAIQSGTPVGDALIAILAQIASGAAGVVVDGALIGNSTSSFPTSRLGLVSKDNSGAPRAYLNWLVFDRNFAFLTGGFKQIDAQKGKENGSNVQHGFIASPNIAITQPGYVYIYLTNETMQEPNASSIPVEVYFDDFKVTHTKSPVIESQDFYPFGLTFNSYSRENSVKNKYLYNGGSERQDALDLNIDLTKHRGYDPAIGRWWQIDPLSDLPEQVNQSPYQYGWNNPIKYNDPNGDCPCLLPALPWAVAALEALFTTAIVGTAGYIAYDAYDRSKFKAQTVQPFNEGAFLNNSSHNPDEPNFKSTKKAMLIAVAIGLVSELIRENSKYLGLDPKQLHNALKNMSESELEYFINNAKGAHRSDSEEITDQQYFGLINPSLLISAYIYDIKKDVYSLQRGLTKEQQAAENEEREKGRQAKQLINNFSNLEEGTYTWNGSNWVLE